MNILLTGGSGLIGTALAQSLISNGHQVRILTRDLDVHPPFYHWDSNTINEKVFEDLDGIIHLAGASLMKRWTNAYKKEIIDSRVVTANLLYQYIEKLNVSLKFFISASGSSYYGQVTSVKIFNENDVAGQDFLAKVCVEWENAANQFKKLGARVVCVRTPMVLAKNADAVKLMVSPTKIGLGAVLGNGRQYSEWIHINDLCRIYCKAVTDTTMTGSFNATTAEHLSHQDFMKQLAQSLNKNIVLPNIPSFLVKIGMGEKSCVVLEGSRLSNQKILNKGFEFSFPTLLTALKDLIR